jgi:DNA-directed RNA polymerase I, II, and III subunit RPABC2
MAPQTMNLLTLSPDNTLVLSREDGTGTHKRSLKLKNPGEGTVAFKVKTTQPKSYIVRPSTGVLKSKEEQEVTIVLQGAETNPNEIASHRFLVQAAKVDDNKDVVSKEEWSTFSKDSIQEQRLNVSIDVKEEAPAKATTSQAQSRSSALPAYDGRQGGAEQGDLKTKYDELVAYTLMLEKEKKKLEEEAASLKSANSGSAGNQSGSFSMLSHFLVAVVVFLLAYGVKFLPDDMKQHLP